MLFSIMVLEYIFFSLWLLLLEYDPTIHYLVVFWSFLNLLIIPSVLIKRKGIRAIYGLLWLSFFSIQIVFFIIHFFFSYKEIPFELLLLVSSDAIPAIFQYHLRYFLWALAGFFAAGLIYHYTRNKEAFLFHQKKGAVVFLFISFFTLASVTYTFEKDLICAFTQIFVSEMKPIDPTEYEKHGAHYPFSDNLEEIKAQSGNNLVHIILESTEKNFLDETLFPNLCPELKKWAEKGIVVENMDMAHNATLTFGGIYAALSGKWLSPNSIGNSIFLQGDGNTVSFPLVLKKAGYKQIFLYGHKNAFFGFEGYLERQGFTTKRIESPHQNYEADEKVFSEGLKEFKQLSSQNKPFNLTILTVNAHAPDGMLLPGMNIIEYPSKQKQQLLDVIHTTDAALGHFLDEISKDPNFKNTTIIIQSDHLSHLNTVDNILNQLSLKPRKMLFVIINSTKKEEINHQAKTFDIAPTVLSAMGVQHNAVFLFGEDLFNKDINAKRLVYSREQERINSSYYTYQDIKNISIDQQNNKYYLHINQDTIPIIFDSTQLPYTQESDDVCILPISPLNMYKSVMLCSPKEYYLKISSDNSLSSNYLVYGTTGEKEQTYEHIKIPPFSSFLIFRKIDGNIIHRIVHKNEPLYIEL